MLVVTPLRSSAPGDIAGDAGGAATNLITFDDFSVDFDFDFSDLFDGFDDDEPLPGLELEVNAVNSPAPETSTAEVETSGDRDSQREEREEEEMGLTIYEEVLSCEMKEEASVAVVEINSPAAAVAEKDRGRKSTARQAKGSNGKRKVKVDWTAELHRRFVQAVEQLGLEKAVPSRILELMGIDCLTRHNVASHLQKYRSHRKHMMAREADQTMSSNKKCQMFATWLPPTIGFPPNYVHPPHHHLHHHPHMQHFRPLHVWGHPTINQSLVHMWPKHIVPIGLMPSPPWVAPHPIQPPPISPHSSPWPPHFAKTTLTQGMPYFPQPLPTLRFSVPGIPPHPMYKPDSAISAVAPPTPPPCKQAGSLLQVDVHPSKESIDAALGGVLAQPWLPLPLGLKPPSLESVMVELHKQGISNVPPCKTEIN